ncbi:hypothetical protein I79_009870 [Cricetulus griseus]|uniref:Uncharacterized protein n=1 Tax=Cricetulus griseus TaxID=10029 RepID=G3HGX6_CRIGR|nr:hypothetical protein I79_009870 [Cricetulus griseus]
MGHLPPPEIPARTPAPRPSHVLPRGLYLECRGPEATAGPAGGPAGAATTTRTQGLHSRPDPGQPGPHNSTRRRPAARPHALFRDPSDRGRKGPRGPRRHFLGAVTPLAGIGLRPWRRSARPRLRAPSGSTRLPPSCAAQGHLPRPPGPRGHLQSRHGTSAEASETAGLERRAAQQAEEIKRPPRRGEARAALPSWPHACASAATWVSRSARQVCPRHA